MTPQAVFDRLISGISAGRWDELPTLYADDAVVEIPFAVPPTRLEGRDAIDTHFAAAAARPLMLEVRDIVVHETSDPEVVIAEFTYDVTVAGRTCAAANIQVVRVRDGKIVASRDYHDHLRLAHVAGRLPDLVAATTA